MSQNETIQVNSNSTVPLAQPDPEVVVLAKRRQFTMADKLRILDEVDRCEPGQIFVSFLGCRPSRGTGATDADD